MTQRVVSAVFDSRSEAERAVAQLRSAGVSESAISVIAQSETGTTTNDGSGTIVDDGDGVGSGLAKGLGVGAGVGALFGLAALAIPGIGPFVAAGALANTLGAAGGAIASGAIVGGTAGGITGALTNYGISDDDARYYETRLNDGGVFVSVDTDGSAITAESASDILYGAGGHSASRAHTETV
ncbi:MAG TPA: hypothetical protein VIT38_09630 [Allosphingosinicella sp.]